MSQICTLHWSLVLVNQDNILHSALGHPFTTTRHHGQGCICDVTMMYYYLFTFWTVDWTILLSLVNIPPFTLCNFNQLWYL